MSHAGTDGLLRKFKDVNATFAAEVDKLEDAESLEQRIRPTEATPGKTV